MDGGGPISALMLARMLAGEGHVLRVVNVADEEALEFHIRLLPEGRVSEHIRNVAKVGDSIRIEGPFGRAHL